MVAVVITPVLAIERAALDFISKSVVQFIVPATTKGANNFVLLSINSEFAVIEPVLGNRNPVDEVVYISGANLPATDTAPEISKPPA